MQNLAPTANSDYRVEIPTKDKTGARFVFTVADLIPALTKASNPDWKRGGVIRNNVTLSYRSGYIPRCEITQLRQTMESVQTAYAHPNERKHLTPVYNIIENGVQRQVGFKKNRLTGEVEPDGLLRTPIYPSDEIQVLAQQLDGVVEMPVDSTQEKEAAQAFLFPNWNEIQAGLAQFPETIQKLKAYFEKRLKIAVDADRAFYVKVAQAAIKSCDDYMAWSNARVNEQNAQYDIAKTKGWAWSYGAEADMLFVQLGIQRRDNLAQANSDQMNQLTSVLAENAKMQSQFMQWQMEQSRINSQLQQAGAQTAPLPPTAPANIENLDEADAAGDAAASSQIIDENEAEDDVSESETVVLKLGDRVIAGGSEGELIFKAKKYKVRFDDNREDTFDKSEVIPVPKRDNKLPA